MKITIIGQVPAQKNDKRIAINRRTMKPFPMTSTNVKEWQELAAWHLKTVSYKHEGKAYITYKFFVKDNRRRDSDNMVCTVNDALVKAGIIEEDSWQKLACDGYDAELDIVNPRVEITIR